MTFLEEWHLPTAYTHGNCMNTMGLSSWIIDVKRQSMALKGLRMFLHVAGVSFRDTHKRWEGGLEIHYIICLSWSILLPTNSCHNMHPSNSEPTLPKISQHSSFNSHRLDKSRWIVFLAAFCCWPTHVFSRRQPGPEAMIGKAIERRGIDLRNLVGYFQHIQWIRLTCHVSADIHLQRTSIIYEHLHMLNNHRLLWDNLFCSSFQSMIPLKSCKHLHVTSAERIFFRGTINCEFSNFPGKQTVTVISWEGNSHSSQLHMS